MGIYDREYYREQQAASGLRGRSAAGVLSMFSVNTWIIALCVAVFVIDQALPRRMVPAGGWISTAGVDVRKLDPSLLHFGELNTVQRLLESRDGYVIPLGNGSDPRVQMLLQTPGTRVLKGDWRPIQDDQTREVVGWQEV